MIDNVISIISTEFGLKLLNYLLSYLNLNDVSIRLDKILAYIQFQIVAYDRL